MLNNDGETTSWKRPVAIYNVNRSRSNLFGESDKSFGNVTDRPNVRYNTSTIYMGNGQLYFILKVDVAEAS